MTMKRALDLAEVSRDEKRVRCEDGGARKTRNPFDGLHDDLLLLILSKHAASAKSPSDLFTVLSSCKRMKDLAAETIVLRAASRHAIAIRASSWCDQAHQFLFRCAIAGNMDACYMLGMIEFYCLRYYARGAHLLAQAAQESHPQALYSLAIIQSRGSGINGGPHCRLDPENAAALCAKSARLGHRDAITEISYCLWKCVHLPRLPDWAEGLFVDEDETEENPEMEVLDEDTEHERQGHPGDLFLGDWCRLAEVSESDDGLKFCSRLCGRRETRRNEFDRCRCNKKFYCSHACREAHWKAEHQEEH